MCLADLNNALLPCRHRWYHLLRPCAPGATLQTCPSKLALEGWEIKCDFCPFCAGWPLSPGEFLLVGEGHQQRQGSVSSAASATSSSDGYSNDGIKYGKPPNMVPLSRRPSLTTTVSAARRESRRWSLARADSVTSVAPFDTSPTYDTGPVYAAGERNQKLNARIDRYLSEHPEHLDRSRSAPTMSNFKWGSLNLGREVAVPDEMPLRTYEEEEEQQRQRQQERQQQDEQEHEDQAARQEKKWKRRSIDLSNFAKAAKRRSRDLGSLFR